MRSMEFRKGVRRAREQALGAEGRRVPEQEEEPPGRRRSGGGRGAKGAAGVAAAMAEAAGVKMVLSSRITGSFGSCFRTRRSSRSKWDWVSPILHLPR